MAATVIDGKAVAASVRERVRGGVEELTGQLGRPPGLATVLVGDDPASEVYVGSKVRGCAEVGMLSRTLISRPNVEKLVRMSDLDLRAGSAADRDELIDSISKSIQIGRAHV